MTTKVQLLRESFAPEVCGLVLTEEVNPVNNKKKLWFNGIFMQAEVRNHNQRNYPVSEVSGAVQRAMESIKRTNGLLGELEHPNTLTVSARDASHIIMDLRMKGNDVYGKAKIMSGTVEEGGTPNGNTVAGILNNGVILGMSSRGTGIVNESTGVVSDFDLVTCDIVTTPSAPGAYPMALREAIEYSKNVNQVLSLAEEVRHSEDAQSYFNKEIRKMVQQLIDKGIARV